MKTLFLAPITLSLKVIVISQCTWAGGQSQAWSDSRTRKLWPKAHSSLDIPVVILLQGLRCCAYDTSGKDSLLHIKVFQTLKYQGHLTPKCVAVYFPEIQSLNIYNIRYSHNILAKW